MSSLDRVINKLQHGEALAPKYHDHELKGKFKGVRECHIKPDWLLTYIKERDVLILTLLDTGTHAEIFGI